MDQGIQGNAALQARGVVTALPGHPGMAEFVQGQQHDQSQKHDQTVHQYSGVHEQTKIQDPNLFR
jgi:hypothetical protein